MSGGEIILLIVLFVVLPLLQQVLSGAGRKREAPARPAPSPAPPPLIEVLEEVAPEPPPEPPPPPPTPLPVARPRRRAPLLGGPRELRRAVVLATILGPCRAEDGRIGRA